MFDYTAVRLPFYATPSPQNLLSSHRSSSSVRGRFVSNAPSRLFLLAVLPLCVSSLLLRPVFLDLMPSYSLFNPHNKPFLLYFLLLYFISYTGLLLPCPCQSLCEFYANHCARIEALRRQLQDEQRGRQVEHTATAGLGWYCSWDVLL